MKYILYGAICFLSCKLGALEYEELLSHERVSIAKVKIMAGEEIGLHRDAHRQIVIALKGGTITRLEADGTTTDVDFPTGVAVFRGIDPPNELHKSVNRGTEPVELLILQLMQSEAESL